MKLQNISIHKNKTCNTWYTRYRVNGKQIYISAKTQKECYDKLKEKLKILKKEKQSKFYTLQLWYEKWLELFKFKKVKESTLNDYKFMLKNINEKLLKKDISKITKIELIEQINNIKGERQREKTFVFLKDIFTKAFNYNVTKENIFSILEKPKHTKKCGSAMTEEEQNIFIEKCLNNNGIIFLIALYQGLRRGECLALTNEDFDINNKLLIINKSQNEQNKISSTKNEYSNRKVPLFNNTINLLKTTKLLKIKGKLFKYTTHSIQDNFKKILKECNFNKDYRIHDLRHTFITNCKNQNIPEHIIQSWVGHNIGSNVTSKVYTHITSDKKEIEILNKFYSNSTQKKED